MKKLLVLMLMGFISLKCLAQSPELLENDWYLHNLIIDGENNIPYGTNYDFEIDFFQDGNQHYFYYGALGLNTVWIDYVTGEQSFEITQMIGLAKNVCWAGNEACMLYEVIYEYFYVDQIGAILDYTIESEGGGTLRLTITTPQGDQAIYRTTFLDVEDFDLRRIGIYPNPVSDVLFISSETSEIQSIAVYTPSAQLVLEQIGDVSQMDVSMLNQGIYFIEITSEEGRSVQKFIKR